MRVLGIDPGLTRCGLGVIETSSGRRVSMVAAGVARTPSDMPLDQRLLHIDTALVEWIESYEPDAVSIEQVFAQHNLNTVSGIANIIGVAMVEAAKRRIPVVQHTPSEVKAAITGSGNADKAQVQHMVARVLGLDEAPKPADAADALAIAICHAWRPGIAANAGGANALTAAQRAWAEAEKAARHAPKIA